MIKLKLMVKFNHTYFDLISRRQSEAFIVPYKLEIYDENLIWISIYCFENNQNCIWCQARIYTGSFVHPVLGIFEFLCWFTRNIYHLLLGLLGSCRIRYTSQSQWVRMQVGSIFWWGQMFAGLYTPSQHRFGKRK